MRHGQTIGSPIAMIIANADWKNWTESLPVEAGDPALTNPSHARAPAMPISPAPSNTISPTPATSSNAPAPAKPPPASPSVRWRSNFSASFGIEVLSHVIAVGSERLERTVAWDEIVELSGKPEVLLGCVDPEAEQEMKVGVDEAYRTGDTVGGIFEVVARGLPPGLGSHITWDSRLDGKLAQAIVSMQAVKGVEVGFAEEGSQSFGSKVQDTIHYNRDDRRFFRGDNRAGGIEGGMTNGQELRVRGFLKPISTLRRPLESVDLETREPAKAAYERSDVCVVPAAGVIGEAMVAIVLGRRHARKIRRRFAARNEA